MQVNLYQSGYIDNGYINVSVPYSCTDISLVKKIEHANNVSLTQLFFHIDLHIFRCIMNDSGYLFYLTSLFYPGLFIPTLNYFLFSFRGNYYLVDPIEDQILEVLSVVNLNQTTFVLVLFSVLKLGNFFINHRIPVMIWKYLVF